MATIFTKRYFSGDYLMNNPNDTILDAKVEVSKSNIAVTNLGNLFLKVYSATCYSGSTGAKMYSVSVPHGEAASGSYLQVLSSSGADGNSGSVDIGTLSATALTLGVIFRGTIATGYTGSQENGS